MQILRGFNLMLRNIFKPLPRVTNIIPKIQARTVLATSPPSVFRTAARTSSYGEFSSIALSTSMAFSASTDRVASLMASILDCGRFGSHWCDSWNLFRSSTAVDTSRVSCLYMGSLTSGNLGSTGLDSLLPPSGVMGAPLIILCVVKRQRILHKLETE